jgi:hypothetical protein
MIFKAERTMNSSWSFWSIYLYEGYRNRLYSLIYNLKVSYLCSPPYKILIILIIIFATHLTAILHAGYLVSCHTFLSLCLLYAKLSKPGRSLFKSESLTLLVDNLYAKATWAVKFRAALSASSPEIISFLGEIKLEASL